MRRNKGSDSDYLAFCVVGNWDQWAGFDVGEAHVESVFFQIGSIKSGAALANNQGGGGDA